MGSHAEQAQKVPANAPGTARHSPTAALPPLPLPPEDGDGAKARPRGSMSCGLGYMLSSAALAFASSLASFWHCCTTRTRAPFAGPTAAAVAAAAAAVSTAVDGAGGCGVDWCVRQHSGAQHSVRFARAGGTDAGDTRTMQVATPERGVGESHESCTVHHGLPVAAAWCARRHRRGQQS